MAPNQEPLSVRVVVPFNNAECKKLNNLAQTKVSHDQDHGYTRTDHEFYVNKKNLEWLNWE